MDQKRKVLVRRYAVVFAVTFLTAASDLWTKRWAESNLATPDHLLPVKAEMVSEGMTVGDVVRTKWPDLDNEVLTGNLYRLRRDIPFGPGIPISRLEVVGLLVFEKGEQAFARLVRLPNVDALARDYVQRNPSLSREEARARARADLDAITVERYLARTLTHLSEEELRVTLQKGVFLFGGIQDSVNPLAKAEPGATYLVSKREIVLIPNHLDFSYVENPAGAWGFLSGLDEETRRTVFLVLSLVAMIVLLALLVRPPSEKLVTLISLGGILGGAVGNVIDRLSNHYVVDFIHMYWGDYHWPRYNIADIGITVGVILLLLFSGKSKKAKTTSK